MARIGIDLSRRFGSVDRRVIENFICGWTKWPRGLPAGAYGARVAHRGVQSIRHRQIHPVLPRDRCRALLKIILGYARTSHPITYVAKWLGMSATLRFRRKLRRKSLSTLP
jgi:hypothetical protein